MHDQAPNEDFKDHYYANLWDLWFNSVPANAPMAADHTIYDTFMYGGFYKVDLRDNLSILVLNSLYMNIDNEVSYQGNEAQI